MATTADNDHPDNDHPPRYFSMEDLLNMYQNEADQGTDESQVNSFTQGVRRPDSARPQPIQEQRLIQRLLKETKTVVTAALTNNICVVDVSLHDLLMQPPDDISKEPELPKTWEYDWVASPGKKDGKTMSDRHGYPLVVWAPHYLSERAEELIRGLLLEFGAVVQSGLSLASGADSSGRNKREAYRTQKDEISGCINVALWHAVGRETTEDAVLSKPQLGSCARFSACEKVVYELQMLSHRMNTALGIIDPNAHKAHQNLREILIEEYPHFKGRAGIDPILFLGRSIIFNRATPNHFDKRDPTIGWTPLIVFGTFKVGGRLMVRRLQLRMTFQPGTCVWIRGRVLGHEVEVFDGGQRISIAHFCHDSVWKMMKLSPFTTANPLT